MELGSMNVTNDVSVNLESFDGETVEVTIRGVTKRLKAVTHVFGMKMRVYGIAGRYRTGTKNWPGFLSVSNDPNTGKDWVDASFGFDSRSAKHTQRPTIFFQEKDQ
jgi:hypothetical protein